MSYVAFQYAEALFGLANESNQVDLVGTELKKFCDSIDTEIANFLNHPKMTKDVKKGIIEDVIENDLLKRLIFVVIDNLRIDLVDDILSEYDKIVYNQHNLMKVKVYSNKKLSEKQFKQLEVNLEKKHNRKIELDNIVDGSIVGGLRIEFEGKILDDTINNYLYSLKANLTK